MVVHHNNAPDNVGAILYSDFLFPVAIIGLLIAHTWMTQRQTEQREDHRSAAPSAPVGAR
jgi:NADH:ubiquinone oxidoreductase subunit 6 (subunit J)